MVAIALTPKQEAKRDHIVEILDRLMQWADASSDEIDRWMDELADEAYGLHLELKEEGQEPTYAPTVLAKRGMKADSKAFYRNMYAVESLLTFLEKGGPAGI